MRGNSRCTPSRGTSGSSIERKLMPTQPRYIHVPNKLHGACAVATARARSRFVVKKSGDFVVAVFFFGGFFYLTSDNGVVAEEEMKRGYRSCVLRAFSPVPAFKSTKVYTPGCCSHAAPRGRLIGADKKIE